MAYLVMHYFKSAVAEALELMLKFKAIMIPLQNFII